MKHLLKAVIPKPARLVLQVLRRNWYDTLSNLAFAKAYHQPFEAPYQLVFRQNILHAATNLGKVENMRLAGAAISRVVVLPNEILSFWRIVGKPSGARGYYKSRNLVNGTLQEDYGGGLCQVSGILYLAALTAGLKIIERHAHSVDIYAENERFVPLGGDATVVYGYKDVRIQNTTNTPIQFKIWVENGQLVCKLVSSTPLSNLPLNFKREDFSTKRKVTTQRQHIERSKISNTFGTEEELWEDLSVSEYKILK